MLPRQAPDRPDLPLLPPAAPGAPAVAISRGTFSWAEDSEPVLRDVELRVPAGALVMVVGPVGAGKTSLLNTLLGELNVKVSLSFEIELLQHALQSWSRLELLIMNHPRKVNSIHV